MKKEKHIKCISCKYTKEDKLFSDNNWTAFECTNPDSEFYKCLLNVTINGEKQHRITWCGCDKGKARAV